MSKIKLLSIAVIGLLILNFAMIFFMTFSGKMSMPQARPPFGPAMEQEGPKSIIIQKLHFDKAQMAEYEKLIIIHQKTIHALSDSIRDAKNILYHSLAEANPTSKDSLLEKLSILQKEVEVTHYQHFQDIKNLCHPDQLPDFYDLTNELARFFGMQKPPGR